MSKYTELITNYHRQKPLFVDHIDLITRPFTDAIGSISGLISKFDIDAAEGVQLDILGKWIGRSRVVSQPISGVYFSFDTDNLGYDQGSWQGPYDPDEGFTSLSDEVYRIVLKAKIAINHWDGTNETLPEILDTALAGSGVRMAIVDNQDMTISIWVLSEPQTLSDTDRLILDNSLNGDGFVTLPDGYVATDYTALSMNSASAEIIAVIKQGYLTVKAAGVFSGEIITPSDGYQFFGFDVDNDYVAGFDNGAWERNL
ncbi:DUF2612 domain-containing protein [Rahnella sp. CJA17(1/100)]|uniref:DUF2612 domain-containing protein n=1 Tax=Rahnella sp. CJA17(1/100) TaxID=2508951 RepID=UPI00106F9585|nr:DUF2612 domain-containing protein [Rahnella sp. CJA17(1/100)]